MNAVAEAPKTVTLLVPILVRLEPPAARPLGVQIAAAWPHMTLPLNLPRP